ncbi:MAG: T9SS type A sorting domain-containing protein [Ignavibacteriaceae bacterium]|nr:T9SS type A sorting domain-containing protein [Ignavibacteriaceae bacterium]
MKKANFLSMALFFLAVLNVAAFSQPFIRIGNVPLPSPENAGFGNVLAGLDLDGDGKKEIYAVNNNWSDTGAELIPTIYKFEFDEVSQWVQVWKAVLPIPKQNTWPALTTGDLDNDGRQEIIWGPVNFAETGNENPWRVVVFEQNPGQENLGIPDPNVTGNFLPNAKWTMTDQQLYNWRPFRWFVHDIDGDNTKEIVFVSRAVTAGGNNIGVMSVSDVPNTGNGSETWTMEFAGGGTTVYYDLALIDNKAICIPQSGTISVLRYANGSYTLHATTATIPNGSWNSAAVVDLNNDNVKEVLVASGTSSSSTSNRNVYLLTLTNDTVVTVKSIGNMTPHVSTTGILMGAKAGDVTGDGKIDFVMGSRGAAPTANITMLSYLGGPIDTSDSYTTQIIDTNYTATTTGRWMHIAIGNVDNEPALEVVYGEGTGLVAPLVIIDKTGIVPVELSSFSASVTDNKVNLTWVTETETNNYGFDIERKTANGQFEKIGFVAGKVNSTARTVYNFTDETAAAGVYSYRLKQIDLDGSFAVSQVIEVDLNAPFAFTLDQNYPNPFNPVTTIRFGLATDSEVSLKVFSMTGELVATLVNGEFKNAGSYAVAFNAANLPSGTYVYRLEAGNNIVTKKMTLLK